MSETLPCFECDTEQPMVIVERMEDFNLDGVVVIVTAKYYHCNNCGEEWENSELGDPYAEAYEKYEQITGKPWKSGNDHFSDCERQKALEDEP